MGVSLDDLLKENSNPLLEDKGKKNIQMVKIIIGVLLTLLVIVIILAVRDYEIKKQINRAKDLAVDIDLISTYIKNVYSEYRLDGDETKLIGISQEDKQKVEHPITLNVNGHKEEYKYGYYYVTAKEINTMVSTLNIKDEDYVLNYSTGDAINLVGAKYNGKTYYSVDDLRAISKNEVPPSDRTIYINTPEDMQYLHEYPDGIFKLGGDIDMSKYATGDGWKPVDEFSGKIDGRGYKIENLTVSRTSEKYCGLFGQLKSTAYINNLKLINVNISGGICTGAIAGTCSGKVYNTIVEGKVSSPDSNVGGAFGRFENGIAENIIIKTAVDGNESVGGFVGSFISGNIVKCSQEGKVTGNSNVGGFVGRISPSGSINLNQVSANTSIIAIKNAGGLIGTIESQNSSDIVLSNSYAKGQIISCNENSGGFVGSISTISGSKVKFVSLYTVVDTPLLSKPRGGFAGIINASNGTSSVVDNCFWEKDNLQDGELEYAGTTNNKAITFESHTPSEMRVIATFGKWNMKIWKFVEGGTPILVWQ